MVEGPPGTGRFSARAGLSIEVPETDEANTTREKPNTDIESARAGAAANETSGRTSGRGEPSGRTSARGEGRTTTGRSSARGHVSARGGAPKSVFCHEAVLKGNVTFGEGCIVHPGAQILAEGGDIIMGDFNIVEEYARIIN